LPEQTTRFFRVTLGPGTDPQLQGKRAVVTGAGQGVGERIATVLADAGCEILVNDLYPERAERTADTIRDADGQAAPLPFDVTRHDETVAAVARAGRIDILVNNAGNAGPHDFTVTRFADTAPGDWERFIDVNLYGVMNCVSAVLPGMIAAGWGRVITIASDAGRTGGSHVAAYSAAKAGAAGFCRAIAREVAPHGITVNTIALGTMRTPLTQPLWDDPAQLAAQQSLLSDYLIRRPGAPDDAAWMTLAVASPRASWVTGQTIPVNGGFSFAL
jgi:3-oxoacyl-[acyl-carrier protein] reductase